MLASPYRSGINNKPDLGEWFTLLIKEIAVKK